MVFPVILYGFAIWSTQSFKCINSVQNRAARYFLNVGRYTPNAAVTGDIGWTPVITKYWKSVLTFWCRNINMDNSRLNKKVFYWSNNTSGNRCKNWHFRVCKLLKDFHSSELCDISMEISKKATLERIHVNHLNEISNKRISVKLFLIDLIEARLQNSEVALLQSL